MAFDSESALGKRIRRCLINSKEAKERSQGFRTSVHPSYGLSILFGRPASPIPRQTTGNTANGPVATIANCPILFIPTHEHILFSLVNDDLGSSHQAPEIVDVSEGGRLMASN
jgi:hypothetical protein